MLNGITILNEVAVISGGSKVKYTPSKKKIKKMNKLENIGDLKIYI